MKNLYVLFGVVVASLLGLDAYFYFAQHRPMRQKYLETGKHNEDLQREVLAVQQELNVKSAELSKTVEMKQAEIQAVQSTKDSLITAMQGEIQKNQIQITQMADKLKLSIVDKILFASGETDVSPEGQQVLARVGAILKNAADKRVRVEGHTDNIPIGGRLKNLYPTNWELSAARATNVVRLLQEKVGMSPKRLEAAGLSEFRPIASNATKEGRAQNRRIEIYLLPL